MRASQHSCREWPSTREDELVWAAFKKEADINFNEVHWTQGASYWSEKKAVYPSEIRDSDYTKTYKTVIR